jgi:hypothetical protein
VALEEREEFLAMIAQLELPASVTGWRINRMADLRYVAEELSRM